VHILEFKIVVSLARKTRTHANQTLKFETYKTVPKKTDGRHLVPPNSGSDKKNLGWTPENVHFYKCRAHDDCGEQNATTYCASKN